MSLLPLDALGDRIMVLGPSNAGKSTLATALSAKLKLPIVHLDQLQHLPNTDWEPRAEDDFKALHDEAILDERWIMDGNYSRLMRKRFERATGVILLTSNHWLRLGRYLKRTLINPDARLGQLEGGQETLKWQMIDWILFKTPQNSRRYAGMVEAAGLPHVHCKSVKDLHALYETWDLTPPT
jgi:adenylate kinase family enzyme